MNVECPHCHTKALVEGQIYNQIDYVNPPAYFRPNSSSLTAIFRDSILLPNKFLACSFCGTIWSKLDNQKLQQFTSRKGKLYEL